MNRLHCSMLLFVAIYAVFVWIMPRVSFDGSKPRPFGLGRKRATVLPVWLVVIAIASLCYAASVRWCS